MEDEDIVCPQCGSKRIASINAKASGLSNWDYAGIEHEGYLPDELGTPCDGDYVEFDYCLDCGQIQDFEPVTDEMIKEVFELDEIPVPEDIFMRVEAYVDLLEEAITDGIDHLSDNDWVRLNELHRRLVGEQVISETLNLRSFNKALARGTVEQLRGEYLS